MKAHKIFDCITFFDNNFMFDLRYNILKDVVDFFVICESTYDHRGNKKNINFNLSDRYDKKKIKYLVLDKPFSNKNNIWENQAIQREFLLQSLNFADPEDYIFFSDPDEILKPELLKNFKLKKKYGIFMLDCFNYKFNLYNSHESPWEGTRVAKKKDLESIDFLRQKIKSKNLKYSLLKFNKEKNIELFNKAGWHFNNIMSPKEISIKLKTFAHTEFSGEKFTNEAIINSKIKDKIDLFERGHKYKRVELDNSFPEFIIRNKAKYNNWII